MSCTLNDNQYWPCHFVVTQPHINLNKVQRMPLGPVKTQLALFMCALHESWDSITTLQRGGHFQRFIDISLIHLINHFISVPMWLPPSVDKFMPTDIFTPPSLSFSTHYAYCFIHRCTHFTLFIFGYLTHTGTHTCTHTLIFLISPSYIPVLLGHLHSQIFFLFCSGTNYGPKWMPPFHLH